MKKLIALSLSFALLLPAVTHAQNSAMALITHKAITNYLAKKASPTCPIERNETAAAELDKQVIATLLDVHEISLADFIEFADKLLAKEWRSQDFEKHLEALEAVSQAAQFLCASDATRLLVSGLEKAEASHERLLTLYSLCKERHERIQYDLAFVKSTTWYTNGVIRAVKAVVLAAVATGMYFGGKGLYNWATKTPKLPLTQGELIKKKVDAQAGKLWRKAERQVAAPALRPAARTAAKPAAVERGPVALTPDEMVMRDNYKLVREAHNRLKADRDIAAYNFVDSFLKDAAKPGFKLSEIGEGALRNLQTYFDHFQFNKQ